MRAFHHRFTVIGLPLRTSNREAAETIPPHWAAFSAAEVARRLGTGGDVYAVYTDHEHAGIDNLGDYTLVIGHRVAEGAIVPEGLVAATVILVETRMPVARVARRAGFGGAEAFSRAFARAYGEPPIRFRDGGAHRSFPRAEDEDPVAHPCRSATSIRSCSRSLCTPVRTSRSGAPSPGCATGSRSRRRRWSRPTAGSRR